MAVACQLCDRGVPAEIVCIDSMTVYRGLDVGTAKSTVADRSLVPHHCLDLVDPCDEYSVGDFQRVALAAVAEIESRGAVPILVGGTGLYVDAVVDELDIPAQYPDIRAALDAERSAGLMVEELHARLVLLDPVAAARMEATNARRIVRALEVCIGSGRTFSSYGPGLVASQRPNRYVLLGLRWDRVMLAGRLSQRLASQFDAGFADEATALWAGGRVRSKTVRQALGYRELWRLLDEDRDLGDRAVLSAVKAEILLRTRQFAVRQERWFRRDQRIRWLDGERPVGDLAVEALEVLGRSMASA
jgi:tRNA dimethylallyltransferase